MSKTIVFLCFPALVPSIVLAEVSQCHSIGSGLDRLACYDRVTGREQETSAILQGRWQVQIETSEFDDSTNVFLLLDSDEPVACGFMKDRQPITFVLRCKENVTSAYFATHCHLASGFGTYGMVEYRIDERKAQSMNFSASTDNSSLGLWRGREAIPFISKLSGGRNLLVRFTPFGENPVTARFNITGVDEAIVQLREACDW